jgi:hypothetical protein
MDASKPKEKRAMEPTDPVALRAQLAVLSIFRDVGIPAGDVLSIGEIGRAWPEYAVRLSDLRPALDALIEERVLALEPGSQDVLVLTTIGERWLREQPGWLKYRLLVPRIWRKRRRGRRAQADASTLRRRRDDAAPQVGAV